MCIVNHLGDMEIVLEGLTECSRSLKVGGTNKHLPLACELATLNLSRVNKFRANSVAHNTIKPSSPY